MSILSRDELRRLEKAAREKDKKHLLDWATQFENQIDEQFRKEYEAAYKDEIACSIDNMIAAVAYTLHFSEETALDKDKLPEFMSDLFATIDMFRTGEYTPQEYKDILQENGVHIDVYDYSRIYKEKQEKLDKLILEYETKLKLLKSNYENGE